MYLFKPVEKMIFMILLYLLTGWKELTFDTTISFDQAFISLFQVTQALGTASVPKDSTAQQVQVEMSRPVPPVLTVTSWD